MTDTEIWDEDWFIDLPNDYKLFFLYIKDRCDHSGMWRPNRRKLQMILHGKMLDYNTFLTEVNKDEAGIKNRIAILKNGKWFLTRFIPFQCGNKLNLGNGAHRGALKLLVLNGVHPKTVPDFDWCGMEKLEMEQLIDMVHGNTLYTLYKGQTAGMGGFIEREREILREREPVIQEGEKGVQGGKTIFKLQHLYDMDFEKIDQRSVEFRNTNKQQFEQWKKFVDWIIEHGYTELFRAIFVNPSDFTTIVSKNQFTEEEWEPVIKKLLSTGIKPEQNLFFRIPDFIRYVRNDKGNGVKESQLSAGKSDFDGMEKWK